MGHIAGCARIKVTKGANDHQREKRDGGPVTAHTQCMRIRMRARVDDIFSISCMTFRLGRLSEVHLRKVDLYMVDMKLNGKEVNLEIDTTRK